MVELPAFAQLAVIPEEEEVALPKYEKLRVKIGVFMPSDKHISHTYGAGATCGIDYLYSFPYTSVGVIGEIGYSFMDKSNEEEEKHWSVLPISGSFLYFPTRNKNLYIGGGAGYYFANERVQTKETEEVKSSERKSGLGFHLVGGYSIRDYFLEVRMGFTIGANAGGTRVMIAWLPPKS